MKLGLGILPGVRRPPVLRGDEQSDTGFLRSFSEQPLHTNTATTRTKRRYNDINSRESVNQRRLRFVGGGPELSTLRNKAFKFRIWGSLTMPQEGFNLDDMEHVDN